MGRKDEDEDEDEVVLPISSHRPIRLFKASSDGAAWAH
jgi:hypothetical protein